MRLKPLLVKEPPTTPRRLPRRMLASTATPMLRPSLRRRRMPLPMRPRSLLRPSLRTPPHRGLRPNDVDFTACLFHYRSRAKHLSQLPTPSSSLLRGRMPRRNHWTTQNSCPLLSSSSSILHTDCKARRRNTTKYLPTFINKKTGHALLCALCAGVFRKLGFEYILSLVGGFNDISVLFLVPYSCFSFSVRSGSFLLSSRFESFLSRRTGGTSGG